MVNKNAGKKKPIQFACLQFAKLMISPNQKLQFKAVRRLTDWYGEKHGCTAFRSSNIGVHETLAQGYQKLKRNDAITTFPAFAKAESLLPMKNCASTSRSRSVITDQVAEGDR